MDLASIVVAILALGILVIVHEGGHFLAARWGGMNVSQFAVGFGPAIYSRVAGGTRYIIGAIPFGGYVQIDGMHPEDGTDMNLSSSFVNRPRHLRAAAILAGPAANYLLAFVMLVGFYWGFAVESKPPFRIEEVSKDSAAEAAGLVKEDIITGANNQPFTSYQDLSKVIEASKGAPMNFQVQRGEDTLDVKVTPAQVGQAWRIGIRFIAIESESQENGLLASVQKAAIQLVTTSQQLMNGLVALVRTPSDVSVSGPVGMIQGLSSQVKRSWVDAYRLVANLSIMLGFFNLLPIPALDGARLVFLAVGAIRRKEVEPRLEAVVHGIGFLLLLGLMVVVSWFDLLRWG